MPKYKYTATDDLGKNKRGVLEAAGEAELQLALKKDGLYLVSFKEDDKTGKKQLKSKVVADFSRQLGSLIGAGVSLVRALNIIAEEDGLKPNLKEIYTALLRSVRKGNALSIAMEEQGKTFPPLMIYMYRAAEASGNLETTAMKMAEHYDKDHKLSTRVKSAFTYPKILGFLIIVVITIIMGFVMPKFDSLFSMMDTLPFATRVLFGLSDLVTQRWYVLISVIVVLVIVFKRLNKIPIYRFYLDKIKVQLPKVGKLLKVIYTARFARTLSSLYSCGISIVNSLQIARNVIGNEYVASQFDDLIAGVRSGKLLSEEMSKVEGFDKKLASSIKVGEESGNLEDLLVSMADTFDYDSELALNRLVSLIEPAMIVIMAVIVGFIMIGVVMPIYNSYSFIS